MQILKVSNTITLLFLSRYITKKMSRKQFLLTPLSKNIYNFISAYSFLMKYIMHSNALVKDVDSGFS